MLVISSTQRKPIILFFTFFFLLLCLYFSPLRYLNVSISIPDEQQQDESSSISFRNADNVDQLISNLEHEETMKPWENSTRANAAFVILTRNSELDALRKTMQQLEERFNNKFNYPYVFLNDEEFTFEFRELTASLTSAKTQYGMIYVYKRLYYIYIYIYI